MFYICIQNKNLVYKYLEIKIQYNFYNNCKKKYKDIL